MLVAGTVVLPALLPADVLAGMQAAQGGDAAAAAQLDPALLTASARAMDAGYIAALLGWLLLFLVGGYLLYFRRCSPPGFERGQRAGRPAAQTPITIPIILAFLAAMSVMNDPNSAVAFCSRSFPFTSPVVMMTRIPCGIPLWEILPLARAALRLVRGDGVARGQNLPRGHLHARQKFTLRSCDKWCRYKY